ncbi:MAG: MFS transporter [bacterium]
MKNSPRLFSPRQWILISACFVLLSISGGMNFNFGIFIKPFADEFQWSRSVISAGYSIYMGMLALSAVLLGGLADRYGARPVVLAGALIYGVSLLLSSRIQSLWEFYLLAGVVAGLGRGSFMVPINAFLQRTFTRNRGLATGLAGAGTGAGILFFSPLTGYLIAALGWRWTYLVLGLLLLAMGIPMALLLRAPARERRKIPPGKGEAAKPPAQAESDPLPEAALGMRAILRRLPFWTISGSHTFDCLCHSVLIVHLVPFAIESGIPKIQAAALLGALGVGAFLGRVLMGVLSDRVGAKRALFVTLLLQTLPIPLLLWTASLPAFALISLTVGLGMGGHGTMYPLVTREYYGPRRVGLLLGAFSTGASLGMAGGAFMGGLLHDITGDYRLSFLFSFTVGVISLFMVWAYPERRLPRRGPAERAGGALPLEAG